MKSVLKYFLRLVLAWIAMSARAAGWEEALATMPLGTGPITLERSNGVQIVLKAFQRSAEVKALIFMPGATDEFYFFKRASARVTRLNPTLLDAVSALTNQTLIRATYQKPFLLLHSAEDPLSVLSEVANQKVADRLKKRLFSEHFTFYDRDWDFLYPKLAERCGIWLRPGMKSSDSWHFYRHSLAGWDLTCWETLEAISLAGQTRFRVERRQIVFEGDVRKEQRATGGNGLMRLNSDQK